MTTQNKELMHVTIGAIVILLLLIWTTAPFEENYGNGSIDEVNGVMQDHGAFGGM